MHMNTKKELEALHVEYAACKNELGTVQEEKERLKIKVKDLDELLKLNKVDTNEEVIGETNQTGNGTNTENSLKGYNCPECDYPCSSEDEKDCHVKKHKEKIVILDVQQICTICKNETKSFSELSSHIQLKHVSECNCQECDFQASSQTILSKHMNLRHRKENKITNDTLKCNSCGEEFSAKWNLNNHIRDKHDRTNECKFFKKGSCRFPQKECWNKHISISASNLTITEPKSIECFTCKNKFNSKNEMMIHRKEIHLEKVRTCKDQVSCGFKHCWFLHSIQPIEAQTKRICEKDQPESESNFQKAPEQPKPPFNLNL